eukprot:CAMPEP_0168737340 /NCGR_PEP_ID=MMETSP0724-20121128/10345_1 /TAXON_ID=265536 /ORGANISM="Amphiprora sp., Strain CCMP467" /LENGTH=366 /DNA_ID=CAMNT_0008784605 /DNA_START=1430 /DNA_END=2530 /DNA_ORIENTATION=+
MPRSRLLAGAKRRRAVSVVDLTADDSNDDKKNDNHNSKNKKSIKKKRAPKKSSPGKTKKEVNEKRQFRLRKSCPQSLRDRFDRALAQRMYLIRKEKVMTGGNQSETAAAATDMARPPTSSRTASTTSGANAAPSFYWKFAMLGSTGNIYDVCLQHVPTCSCPDFARRGDLCKHLIFVLVRCVGLVVDHPLAYQKAYITSELHELNSRIEERNNNNNNNNNNTAPGGGGVWANTSVQTQYAKIKDRSSNKNEDEDNKDRGKVQRRALEDQDCPICLEELSHCPLSQVTYCKLSCGMNFHVACMAQWKRAAGGRNVTCPNCRAVEEPPPAAAARQREGEGYVNMGRLQGQSPDRDTSTYYRGSPWRRY